MIYVARLEKKHIRFIQTCLTTTNLMQSRHYMNLPHRIYRILVQKPVGLVEQTHYVWLSLVYSHFSEVQLQLHDQSHHKASPINRSRISTVAPASDKVGHGPSVLSACVLAEGFDVHFISRTSCVRDGKRVVGENGGKAGLGLHCPARCIQAVGDKAGQQTDAEATKPRGDQTANRSSWLQKQSRALFSRLRLRGIFLPFMSVCWLSCSSR